MKKWVSLLMSVVMLASSFMLVSALSADTSPDISCVISPTEVKMGEEITITVSVSGYEPIRTCSFMFSYNRDVFEFSSESWMTAGVFSGPFDERTLAVSGMFTPAADINGEVYKLVLRAKEDAAIGGDLEITVKPQLRNTENQNVETETEISAQVNVSCVNHKYGDMIPENPAACGVAGKRAYYECSVCHKLFDSKMSETTEQALVIPALSHKAEEGWHTDADNHWKVCANGCGTIMDGTKAGHSFIWKVDKPATEDNTGLKHEECSVCGYKNGNDAEIPKLDHTHIGITVHDAVPATCHSTGTVKYWTCASEKCKGKYYGDADCSIELENITEAINPNNHDGKIEIRDAKEATCTQEGYTGDTWCLGCNQIKETGKTIPATNIHKDADGKWETDDSGHWHTCVCGQIIDKSEHTGGEATCIQKAICEVCGSEYGEISEDNHKNTELRNVKAATEEAEGYSGDTWCNDCGKEIATGTVTPILVHTYGNIYQSDEENHWKECENGCGTIAEKAAHTFGEWTVTKDATTEEKGSREKECTVCGYKVTEEIPVLDKVDTNSSESGTADTEKTPQTGEHGSITYWVLLFSISGIALLGTTVYRKKRIK